jgi:hypothetical protein
VKSDSKVDFKKVLSSIKGSLAVLFKGGVAEKQ